MSTSLLYHAWSLQGYTLVSTSFRDGTVQFELSMQECRLCCPECGSADVIRKGSKLRSLRACPIGLTQVWLTLAIPRVRCDDCGITRQVKLGFADPDMEHTRQFARYATDLLSMATIQDVARHLGVSWGTIKNIEKARLQAKYAKPKLGGLERIAIDEIYLGRKKGFVTLVLDLDTGAIVFVGKGKDAKALQPFWLRLRRSGAKVKAVSIDMSKAYISAVRENLPEAVLVFDRFHVTKLFNDKLSTFRAELQREAEGALQKKVLKNTLWLLLRNAENINAERKGRKRSDLERLEEALKLNQPLATVHYFKEDLRQLWNQPDRKTASAYLDDWLARAESAGIRMLTTMSKTLRCYREGILNYYKHSISTAAPEGTNNKIRTVQRQAYGYRDDEFFHLKLLGLHESRYALVG